MANLLQLALAAALCASLAIAAPRDLTVSWNTVTGAAPPVNVTYYYESLCKGCEGFIRTGMTDTWNKLKQYNMMFIELRPHGNARVSYTRRNYSKSQQFYLFFFLLFIVGTFFLFGGGGGGGGGGCSYIYGGRVIKLQPCDLRFFFNQCVAVVNEATLGLLLFLETFRAKKYLPENSCFWN